MQEDGLKNLIEKYQNSDVDSWVESIRDRFPDLHSIYLRKLRDDILNELRYRDNNWSTTNLSYGSAQAFPELYKALPYLDTNALENSIRGLDKVNDIRANMLGYSDFANDQLKIISQVIESFWGLSRAHGISRLRFLLLECNLIEGVKIYEDVLIEAVYEKFIEGMLRDEDDNNVFELMLGVSKEDALKYLNLEY